MNNSALLSLAIATQQHIIEHEMAQHGAYPRLVDR